MSIARPIDEVGDYCRLDCRFVCGAQMEDTLLVHSLPLARTGPAQARASGAVCHMSFLGIPPRGGEFVIQNSWMDLGSCS